MGGTEGSILRGHQLRDLMTQKVVKEEIANSKVIMPERTPIIVA